MTSGTNARDLDTRAALLHALSTPQGANFEMANSLNRERQSLSNTALAYLALTFANLNRPELASEILGILIPRAKVETAAPGRRSRLYWRGIEPVGRSPRNGRDDGAGRPGLRPVRPQAAELDQADRLAACPPFRPRLEPAPRPRGRQSPRWPLYHGRAQGAEDRYRLTVTVNDTEGGRASTVEGIGGEPRHRRAREGPQGRRFQPRRPGHGRAGHVQLRGHHDRIHP